MDLAFLLAERGSFIGKHLIAITDTVIYSLESSLRNFNPSLLAGLHDPFLNGQKHYRHNVSEFIMEFDYSCPLYFQGLTHHRPFAIVIILRSSPRWLISRETFPPTPCTSGWSRLLKLCAQISNAGASIVFSSPNYQSVTSYRPPYMTHCHTPINKLVRTFMLTQIAFHNICYLIMGHGPFCQITPYVYFTLTRLSPPGNK